MTFYRRFEIHYHVGENLKPSEINIKDSDYVTIVDNSEELPILRIDSESDVNVAVAEKYVGFMNNEVKQEELDKVIWKIKSQLKNINDLNYDLIKPPVNTYYDEGEEELMETVDLIKELQFEGYRGRVERYTDNINKYLDELKNIALKKGG